MNARLVAALIIGLAIGLLLGRAAPQADLRDARAQLEELKRKGSAQSTSRSAIAGVETMLKVRQDEVSEARRRRPHAPPAAADLRQATGTVAAAATNAASDRARRGSMSNEIAQAKQAWQLRSEIARKGFLERTKLDQRQTADFDVVIEAMNLRLGTSVDRWAEQIHKADTFTPETGIRMMNELSQALVVTYDELDRKMPPTWRQDAGPTFELVRFIDPEVLTPLQDLEPVMAKSPPAADGIEPPGAP